MPEALKPSDISKPSKRLAHITAEDLPPLPPPYEDFNKKTIAELKEEKVAKVEASLDDTIAIGIPKPKNKEEEESYLRAFLSGLQKLFQKENNWGFLQPLLLSMDHCAKCQTCSESCPVFETQRTQGNLPPELSVRSSAEALPEICQTLWETLGQAYRRH